jgi:hypothetical protein
MLHEAPEAAGNDPLPLSDDHRVPADGRDRFYGVPQFDVVLRGYDRRQVDEHISRLQRGQQRAAAARAVDRAAEESVRTSLAELVRQRDAALADLAQARRRFETPSDPIARITLPAQQTGSDAG